MIIISNEKVHAKKDMYVFHDKENGTWFIKFITGPAILLFVINGYVSISIFQ